MSIKPADTTCSEESCQRQYRLGKETRVVFIEPPEESFFITTCPSCGTSERKPFSDTEGMRRSLERCNNFSQANPVAITDLTNEGLEKLLGD